MELLNQYYRMISIQECLGDRGRHQGHTFFDYGLFLDNKTKTSDKPYQMSLTCTSGGRMILYRSNERRRFKESRVTSCERRAISREVLPCSYNSKKWEAVDLLPPR